MKAASDRLLFCLLLLASGSSEHALALDPNNTNLTFMLITSFGQFGFNSSGGLPAAEMALEDINNNPDVLPGYNLVYDSIRDSQCHREKSLDTFFDGILSEPVKIAVVGCGCSPATEPVAEISHQWNISQISYSSGSAALSDRDRFKKYFRNSPRSDVVAPTLRSVMEHFNWTRVALITQDEVLFTSAEARFRDELENINVTVTSRRFQTGTDPSEIKDVFVESEDYRVFVTNSYSGPAKQLICEAYKRNYTYPKYAWITFQWYPPSWWTGDTTNNVEVDCTEEQLEKFSDRVLILERYENLDDENATTDVGRMLGEFEDEYKERAANGSYLIVDVRFRIYDVLWALALALNQTMTMVESLDINGTGCESMNGSLVPLHQFDYANAMMGCLIQWNLQQTDFNGLTGEIKFDDTGTRLQGNVSLRQYRYQGNSLLRKRFAIFPKENNFELMFEVGENTSQVYPDGAPPDGSPQIVIHTYNIGLVVVFYLLITAGLVLTAACLIFNFMFRKRKIVKLSSPNLNYLIIIGAMFMYLSVYFHLLPVTGENAVQAGCIVEHWLFTVGYSLAFGTVLAKMWRVYQIFNNPKVNRNSLQVYKDWHLFIVILVITGTTVVLLLLETTIPFLRGSISQKIDQEDPLGKTDLNVTIKFYILLCNERLSPNIFWQAFIFCYLAVLQIIGIVLAIQTRKVKLHGLRDSKFIAAIIYISSIVLVVLMLVIFALNVYINSGAAIYSSGVLLLATFMLILVFVPKMVMLYKDPDGETVGRTPSLDVNNVIRLTTNQSGNSNDETEALTRTMEEKDARINELTQEIDSLKVSTSEEKERLLQIIHNKESMINELMATEGTSAQMEESTPNNSEE